MPFKDPERLREWTKDYEKNRRKRTPEQIEKRREQQKAREKEKVLCESCKKWLNRHSLLRHQKTQTHIKNSIKENFDLAPPIRPQGSVF